MARHASRPASCQKVLGGWGNLAVEYATKRYRSNLINWGMLPFTTDETTLKRIALSDMLYLPGIRQTLTSEQEVITAYQIKAESCETIQLMLKNVTPSERDILLAGCLINYYRG